MHTPACIGRLASRSLPPARSPNTGKAMFESKFIIEYLNAVYAIPE
jgi:hypothetical protein